MSGSHAARRHPILVVARRTGLTADILRAWEKRYKAVSPDRTPGDRRLYSEDDIERLLLLRRAIQGGHSIGQVGGRPTADLKSLVESDAVAARRLQREGLDETGRVRQGAAARPARADDAEGPLARCFAAVLDLDAPALERHLARASATLGHQAMVETVLAPLLRRIGERWHDGSLRIAHEHLATAVVRSFLSRLSGRMEVPETSPRLVVGTPVGQHHELAALFTTFTAASEGWRPIYLGSNLPAEEIAAATGHCGARAVALSITYPPDDPRLAGELRRLRRLMPRRAAIVVGGSSAEAYSATLEEIGVTPLPDMPALVVALRGLRAGGGA